MVAEDYFYRLPDPLALQILSLIEDAKSLAFCMVVSTRFRQLVAQVPRLVLKDVPLPVIPAPPSPAPVRRGVLGFLLRCAGRFRRYFQSAPRLEAPDADPPSSIQRIVAPYQAVEALEIVFEQGELDAVSEMTVEEPDGAVLKWYAEAGSTLEWCLVLMAPCSAPGERGAEELTVGTIRPVVTGSVGAILKACARLYHIRPAVAKMASLSSLVVRDADGQGLLVADSDQLVNLRSTPVVDQSGHNIARTLVPTAYVALWLANNLQFPGASDKGGALAAINMQTRQMFEKSEVERLVRRAFCGEEQSAALALLRQGSTDYSMIVEAF